MGTQTDPVVFASQVNMADAGCQTVYDKCGLQTKVETMILRNELNIARAICFPATNITTHLNV